MVELFKSNKDYLLLILGKAHKHIKNIELHYQLMNDVIEHL